MISYWLSLFKNKKFIFLWFSQIFSQISLNILNFSILFSLFENTGSSIATSFVWISYAIPSLLIGPAASAIVDMYDKRMILMVTNLLQTLVILFYAILPFKSHYVTYSIVILFSTINQFYVPSELSSLAFLAGKKLLAEANGVSLLTQQASMIIGFGGAGIVMNIFGFQNTIAFCSFLTFLAFLSTCYLPKIISVKKISGRFEKLINEFFSNITTGYKLIIKSKYILAPLFIMLCMQISLTVVAVNAPAIADEIFEVPVKYSGIFFIIPAGIGSVTASFLVSRKLQKGVRKFKLIKSFLLSLLLSFLLIIFLIPVLDSTPKYIALFFVIIIMGFSYIGLILPTQTFLQQETPFKFRGRVFGNYWFLVNVLSVFPIVFSGTVSEILGSRVMLIFLAVGISALYLFLISKEKKFLLPEGYKH